MFDHIAAEAAAKVADAEDATKVAKAAKGVLVRVALRSCFPFLLSGLCALRLHSRFVYLISRAVRLDALAAEVAKAAAATAVATATPKVAPPITHLVYTPAA